MRANEVMGVGRGSADLAQASAYRDAGGGADWVPARAGAAGNGLGQRGLATKGDEGDAQG